MAMLQSYRTGKGCEEKTLHHTHKQREQQRRRRSIGTSVGAAALPRRHNRDFDCSSGSLYSLATAYWAAIAVPAPPSATGPSLPRQAVSTSRASGSAANCANAGAAICTNSTSIFRFESEANCRARIIGFWVRTQASRMQGLLACRQGCRKPNPAANTKSAAIDTRRGLSYDLPSQLIVHTPACFLRLHPAPPRARSRAE